MSWHCEILTSPSRGESNIRNAINIHFLFVWNEDVVWYEKRFLDRFQMICWWMTPLLECLLALMFYWTKLALPLTWASYYHMHFLSLIFYWVHPDQNTSVNLVNLYHNALIRILYLGPSSRYFTQTSLVLWHHVVDFDTFDTDHILLFQSW